MRLPEKFEAILKSNQTHHLLVLDVLTSIEPVLTDNKLFFFEEFTDHGKRHVEAVLAAAENIIWPESMQLLTSKDIMILVFSVLLHDLGMHCEFATFCAMINGDYDDIRIGDLDAKTWGALWKVFLSEAKRFSSRQKKDIFGNERQEFREPILKNKDDLTGIDKKLIGEFIRRHHARLAHEVALKGLYGPGGQKIPFGTDKLSEMHRTLAGIVARSHGLNIRDTYSFLERIAAQSWRTPDDIHIFFLMAILRIADYIQIDQERVSSILLRLKTFSSPVSIREHESHLAIKSLSFMQPDKERIFALCDPKNSEMFVKLRNLFQSIQSELDVSWAVLGEIYGFIPEKSPKLKYRRIDSNLESHTFLDSLEFVPRRIKFEVNSELSKLLVGPLYGNNPTFGVRELVQNAVDACLEQTYLEKTVSSSEYIPSIKVSISTVSEDSCEFRIQDNGKGMSLDEIIEYFLNVGSSFRKSMSWRKQFTDENAIPLINRNGKFGIGILAAFLIGDEITVRTRHRAEQFSYEFRARIDSDFIDIKRLPASSSSIGTTISILATNETKEALLEMSQNGRNHSISWTDWYISDHPAIIYKIDDEEIPRRLNIDKSGSHSFEAPHFKKIEWKYIGKRDHRYWNNGYETMVVCNGIIITRNLEYEKIRFANLKSDPLNRPAIRDKPSLFIEDPEGIFPIKLDRNDIDCTELPFETELFTEVAKGFVANLLKVSIDPNQNLDRKRVEYSDAEILYNKNGYCAAMDFFVDKLVAKHFSLIRIITTGKEIPVSFLDYEDSFILPLPGERINLTYQERHVAPWSGRFALKKRTYADLFKSPTKRLTMRIKNQHKLILETAAATIYDFSHEESGEYESKSGFFKNLSPQSVIDFQDIESIQELDFRFIKTFGGDILNNLLAKYLGEDPIIPYDLNARMNKFPNAFKDLAAFMDAPIEPLEKDD